jgi:hypothetical protein
MLQVMKAGGINQGEEKKALAAAQSSEGLSR